MIKILHIISGLKTGGAEMMLYKVVSSSRHQVEHSVLCLSDDRTSLVSSRLLASGIPVFYLNFDGLFGLLNILCLFKFVKIFSPDILQGWMYHGNLVSIFIRFLCKFNTPIVWNIRRSLHALHTEKWTTRLVIRLNSKFSFLPTKIIYNSMASAAHHQGIGFSDKKTVLIPNGFDLSLFLPDIEARSTIRQQLGFVNEEIVIGLVGRYHPVKGHKVFLEAAGMLVRKYSNVRFVLVGERIDYNNRLLSHVIAEHNVSGYVVLLGCRADVHVVINSFDIYTSASLGEAFSNTLGEAMATAIPCVATDVGESKILLDKYGFIVKPNSAASLYEGWCKVIEMDANERKIMAHSGREHIKNLYSLDRVSSLYSKLYADLK